MRFISSLLFNIFFYLGTLLYAAIVCLLVLWPSPAPLQKAIHFWMKATIAAARLLLGLRIEYRGLDKVPQGAVVLCAKHQSVLDSVLLYNAFPTVTALGKMELKHIPFVGLLLSKIGVIWIDRKSGKAHVGLDRSMRAVEAAKRPIIVYPEGTRVRVGQRVKLKSGVFFLQKDMTIPIVPVATNAGLFWPKAEFMRSKGTVVMEFGPPFPKMDDRDTFMAMVEKTVIERSDELMRTADIRGRNRFLDRERIAPGQHVPS